MAGHVCRRMGQWTLSKLRALLTIAETGSVTRAADILHTVQPALSRQVKLLE
jgi:LysR family transcriptional regulator, nitrogen assimilation regulatory protein